jgi:hypothetical protein
MTLLLTIASDGSMAPAYLLFKGLKKAPQCDYPATIIPNASSSGTMDEYLFIDFIEKVLVSTYSNKRMLLLLDQCRSHMTDLVRAKLRYHNIQPIYIPGKYFFTQKSTFPIDLIIYVSFKPDIRRHSSRWTSALIGQSRKHIARSGSDGLPKFRRVIRLAATEQNLATKQ